MTSLDVAFDKWLSERRDDLSLRTQFWLAWKAGAEWALDEIKNRALPDSAGEKHGQ